MRCLVTAGPTYEPLDEVRRLTNFSTGGLGISLANFLTSVGHDVVLLKGYYSTAPDPIHARATATFTTSEDLAARIRGEKDNGIEAVFHAAAVSDFRFGRVWERKPDSSLVEVESAKFSTRTPHLLAELIATEKILHSLRHVFPGALLIGWKYELNGTREDVLAEAQAQIVENQTDGCVANGRAYGSGFGFVTRFAKYVNLPDRDHLIHHLGDFLTSPSPTINSVTSDL